MATALSALSPSFGVEAYLDRALEKPWRYGGGAGGFEGQDCTLFAADWVLEDTGIDPAAGWRARYDSEASAARLMSEAGRFTMVADMALAPAGFRRIERDPQPGDVAYVMAPSEPDGRLRPVPAIFSCELWVTRMRTGIRAAEWQRIVMWSRRHAS